jgi:hypothetical protein
VENNEGQQAGMRHAGLGLENKARLVELQPHELVIHQQRLALYELSYSALQNLCFEVGSEIANPVLAKSGLSVDAAKVLPEVQALYAKRAEPVAAVARVRKKLEGYLESGGSGMVNIRQVLDLL